MAGNMPAGRRMSTSLIALTAVRPQSWVVLPEMCAVMRLLETAGLESILHWFYKVRSVQGVQIRRICESAALPKSTIRGSANRPYFPIIEHQHSFVNSFGNECSLMCRWNGNHRARAASSDR